MLKNVTFENVFAAIIMIGILGLATDLFLAGLGKALFPWKGETPGPFFRFLASLFRSSGKLRFWRTSS